MTKMGILLKILEEKKQNIFLKKKEKYIF